MTKVDNWDEVVKLAAKALLNKKFGSEYLERLKFELKEIEKQGAGGYWIRAFNEHKKFEQNKPGLILPFLLGLTDVDPIQAKIKHIVTYQPDYPDIDIDFLPIARNP